MLSAKRAFSKNALASQPLPQVPELGEMYSHGISPRMGDLVMIAGRPGSQKSGFALFWVAKMGLPCLYFSGDSTPWEMTSRLVAMNLIRSPQQIEQTMEEDETTRSTFSDAIDLGSNIDFVFSSPITFQSIDDEVSAYVELHNAFPPIIVIDNLMDCQIPDVEGEYQLQREVLQNLTELSRTTGSTVIVTHHAREVDASDPEVPAPRDQIKNRSAEKPQLTLSVALWNGGRPDRNGKRMQQRFRVAAVKQRAGRSDPTAHDFFELNIFPEYNWFGPTNNLEPWNEV